MTGETTAGRPGQALTAILDDPRVAVSRVIAALYTKDEAAGYSALAELRSQLDPAATDPELSAEQREVLALYACWLEWQLTLVFREAERDARHDWLSSQLAQQQSTVLGEVMRAKLQLQLGINSEGPGHFDFLPEQFHPIYRRIPEPQRHGELMYFVASWAFRHRELAVLEDAFEHFTIYADGHISDYVWQYVNIMYQLLLEKATHKDVSEHLKRMEFMHQLIQFELYILPEIERQGLLSDALQAEIESNRQRIAQTPPHPPQHEAPTKRMRTDL